MFFDIIMRYSLKTPSLVQYFVVLGKSIFLHFRPISNKLKKVVSIRVEMVKVKLLYYKNESQVQMLLESATFLEGFISFPIAPIKIATMRNALSISHQIRFCTSSDK
ncbi:hypothetical protein T12_7830, partial [Trichinella patagoniensis]